MARYIDADKLALEVQRYLMPNVNDDGTVTIENAERYFLNLIQKQPTADVMEVKQIARIRNDLKWWLDTNTEKGVVYMPEFTIERMIAKMDGGEN